MSTLLKGYDDPDHYSRRSSFISVYSYDNARSFSLSVSPQPKKKPKLQAKKSKSKVKKLMRQLTKLSVIENLTYEESEIRLILLGVISSICLVTCATAFALIVNRISGYFKDPIIVPYQSPSYQTIGFPIPTILVIDHTGSFLT